MCLLKSLDKCYCSIRSSQRRRAKVKGLGKKFKSKISFEPNDSCNELGSPRKEEDIFAAYKAAKRHILEKRERNCCTIGPGNLVTRWQLKQDKTVVEVKAANSTETTFWRHNKLKIEIK